MDLLENPAIRCPFCHGKVALDRPPRGTEVLKPLCPECGRMFLVTFRLTRGGRAVRPRVFPL